MFRFANPEYLYLLFILPVLVVGFILLNIQKLKAVKKLGDLKLIKRLMPELSLKRSYLKFWLIFAVIVFGVIVAARPQFGTKIEKVDKKGIELVIAIDVSNSMLARDVNPDRLSKAKQILTRIIDERKNDKVAIVVFAGEAYVQLPMTTDIQSAKIFLENIDPSLVPVQGTVIGSAINIAMNSFTNDKEVDKSIILITDGEDHEDNGVQLAEQAAAAGIQINVVGVGSPEGSPIPVSPTSNEMKKDNEGNIVVTKLNEDMCKQIAQAGKGMYVRADNSNNALKSLQAELDKLQKKNVEGSAYSEYDEKFQFFAWCMLILLLVEICIFDKKNRIFRNIRLFR
ncbi:MULTISPECIES: vWA domain-containing protein [unclassified Dysgonomonas]|uniref:vWA domain-containing protein n=1 Tax=unclassified Dysgonomonas TaxID=2630389 RepID=UPI000681A82E|nr:MULTISPECIES: VWA domain-containing protein [unclassified Dysgonomonas]MBD8348036.1 VWA domain-containing protein [Dysgonomonas sp. HGC4]MBF0575711.1 VWA domain-containing protein [Dysgonomonas sp. GY617]